MPDIPEKQASAQEPGRSKRFGCLQILTIIVVTAILTAAATAWAVHTYLFAPKFEPVTLTAKEERHLHNKLERFESMGVISSASAHTFHSSGQTSDAPRPDVNAPLTPEPYSEVGANRTIIFTEREINALLATNTDLAQKLAIDFSENLISANMRIPVEPDFPILGGKTIRMRAGLHLSYRDARPVVIVKGVSLMGIPIPNAWMGGVKNIDLIQEFGQGQGLPRALADGVEDINVEQGVLKIKLKE